MAARRKRHWLDRWVTPGAQKMLVGMAVLGLPTLACWLLVARPFEERSPMPSHRELEVMVQIVPRGSTEAEVLAFLRAQGFLDRDIRLVTNLSYDGNRILAQSGPRRAFALNPRYLVLVFKFDEQGRLWETGVTSDSGSLAELDAYFQPGGIIVYSTPPPAR